MCRKFITKFVVCCEILGLGVLHSAYTEATERNSVYVLSYSPPAPSDVC
jgi:hypothetical protein